MEQNTLTLVSREKLTLQNVEEIISYDDELIELYTTLGGVRIRGKGLVIDEAFSTGTTVIINGYIKAIIYSDGKEKLADNIITRLFR